MEVEAIVGTIPSPAIIMDNFPVEEGRRECRQRKKQTDQSCCPVCGVTLRSNEMEHHYSLEVDRLSKLSSHSKSR